MLALLKQLRRDEDGVILSTEIVIVGSLLVVGLITGVTCLQHAVDGELRDLGNAIGSLDQSYSFAGRSKSGINGLGCAWTAGSSYLDCEHRQLTTEHQDVLGIDPCCQHDCLNVEVGCHHCIDTPCNHCQSRGPAIIHSRSCGGCGSMYSGAGCGRCSQVGGMRILNSGVPNMKISEWDLPPSYPMPHMVPGELIHGQLIPHTDGILPLHNISSNSECCKDRPAHRSGDILIPDHVW